MPQNAPKYNFQCYMLQMMFKCNTLNKPLNMQEIMVKPYKQLKQEQSETLIRLIEYAGSQSRLARGLNVSPQVVQNWVKRGRISASCAIDAEALTGGFITKRDLRPDVETWINE